jgi:hypothetical protein
MQTQEPALQDLIRRALETGKTDLVQVWFQSSVLDRYREDPDSRILRSDSAGRLRAPGGWMINFGISPGDALIHMPVATAAIIPEGHREHWLSHVVGLPVGVNFVRMTLSPNACIGDGESRPW